MKDVTSWEKVPVIFDLQYAATILGMNHASLRTLAQRGQFPAFKSGKLWRVNKTDFLEWIEKQKIKESKNGDDSEA